MLPKIGTDNLILSRFEEDFEKIRKFELKKSSHQLIIILTHYQMNFNPEILGLIAGTLSCITFVPQIFKTWKSKSVKDISVTSFMIVVTSTFIWLVYGIWKELPSVILTNVVVCISAVIMLLLKWKYSEK